MADPLLAVHGLTVRFRTEDGFVHAVNGIDFELEPGQTLGLVGESGSGKSAACLALMGLLPRRGVAVGGRALFAGRDLLALGSAERRALRGRALAMIFQDPMTSLNPVLAIGRQVTEALTAHRRMNGAEARREAAALLGRAGIAEPERVLTRFPHQLSGGMRQRVMIAIALALRPRLLIADEPTTALDVTIQAQVLELIRALTRESETAVILITHDLGVVASMSERVTVMYAGLVVESAPTGALFAHPRHPYTAGLLHCIPRIDREAGTLVSIEGAPPENLEPPHGCPFAPRCAWASDVCAIDRPALRGEGGHRVACHHPLGAEEARFGRPLAEPAARA